MNTTRRALFAVIAAGAMLSAGTALAQVSAAGYPSKPVTIISGTPPGAINDADGRMWSQKLGAALGKPFVMDFKPGAGSTIGTNYVAKSAPDGHTLMIITGAFTISAALYKDLPYDPVKDLVGVSLTVERPVLLVVNPQLPVRSFAEYVAYTKANPGKLNFSTPGIGTPTHMGGAWLHSLIQTEVTFVHYKGSAQMLVDLAAGRVNATASNVFNSLPMLKAGKSRAIAVMSAQPSALLPGIKTVAQEGIPGFGYSSWGGIIAPAKVPPAIINRLSSEFGRMMKDPDVIEKMTADGTVLVGSSSDYFQKYLVSEIDRWRKVAKQYDITAEDE